MIPRAAARRLLAWSLLALASFSARAQESGQPASGVWQTLGLLRVRDMSAFGISRLDMLPAPAFRATAATFALEVNSGYQNTWAMSKNVRDYLTVRGIKRGEIGPAEVDAILALPGDAYLVDGEFGVVDLTLHYRTTPRFGFYATVPYFTFQGGFLDGTIEAFHSAIGIPNGDRDRVPRNRFLALADLEGTRVVVDRPPADGLGDPIVGVRFAALSRPGFGLVFESAVKLALFDRRRFVASGREDYGLQVSFQRFLRRNALYLTLAGVYSQSPDPGLADNGWIPTAILGWETKVSRHANLVFQTYFSRSSVQGTELDELSATKIQATLGVQWLYRGHVLRFGVTENIANFDNTPDIGVNLSLARILFGKTP